VTRDPSTLGFSPTAAKGFISKWGFLHISTLSRLSAAGNRIDGSVDGGTSCRAGPAVHLSDRRTPLAGIAVTAGWELGSRRDDWLGYREPEEIAARQLHLGNDEMVVGGKEERFREKDVKLNLLSRHGAVTAGLAAGFG
jgi:hypothetical protein